MLFPARACQSRIAAPRGEGQLPTDRRGEASCGKSWSGSRYS